MTVGTFTFTTSWDDGHPLDLKLADALARRGFTGTFYVPLNNDRFGLPVLAPAGLRELGARCELASHTLDHCYLTTVPAAEARQQIRDGRAALEDVLGHRVTGFCYPGGQYAPAHRDMVRDEGFAYARTTVNLRFDAGDDAHQRPTTLQFYPHPRLTYAKNWLRRGDWALRAPLALRALSGPDLLPLMKWALHRALDRGGHFHLWGHSWEIDDFGGWGLLDEFLLYAADVVPPARRLTNHQALAG